MTDNNTSLRSWALSHSIEANKSGTPTNKILNDAKLYYNFLTDAKPCELIKLEYKSKK